MDISALGEFELIARLTAGLSKRPIDEPGIGDDCAVLDIGGAALLLATCDSQVEGRHFTFQTSRPEEIGRKALAVNLSDVAAMGGEPRYALISLLLPPQLPLERLDAIYAGLRAEAEQYATTIVGGNIAGTGQSAQLVIDITLLGTIERGHVVTRGGAQKGDLLCVTGGLGDSAAGLYSLLHPDLLVEPHALEFVRRIHTTPQPRVPEGRLLGQLGPSVVTAMLDISDGLSGDLHHLCERSQVGVRVDLARLPLSLATRVVATAAGLDPLQWALHGGEDYELLFTIAPQYEQRVVATLQSATGTQVSVIGTILALDAGMRALYPDGHEEALNVQSWDHLKR